MNKIKKDANQHLDGIYSLIQLRDGRLASGSFDFTIKIWTLRKDIALCLATLTSHNDTVCCLVQLSNDDNTIASCSWDSTIKIWNIKTYQLVTTIQLVNDSFHKVIQLNNGVLASGSWSNSIQLWSMYNWKPIESLNGHLAGVSSLIQLKDNKLASGSYDHLIKLWDLNSMKCIQTLQGHKNHVIALIQMEDNRIASASFNGAIIFWQMKQNNKYYCIQMIEEYNSPLLCLIQLNFMWLITGGNKLRIWDINTGVCIKTIKKIKNCIYSIVVLSDDKLACATKDKQIIIIKIQ